MSKSVKRLFSLFVVIMLMLALGTTFVLLQSRKSIVNNKNNTNNTNVVANINPNAWDGNSNKSGNVRFALDPDYPATHVTMTYPTKIYLDKTESLGSAGYYFHIVSGSFGGSPANRVYINPHIWGYRKDTANSPMGNIFNDYYFIAQSQVDTSLEVNVKTTSGIDDETKLGIDTDYGRVLLNAWKISDDSAYNVKIKLQGTPKSIGTFNFNFSSVAGMHYTSSMISTQQWTKNSNWSSSGAWRELVHYNNMDPSPISIAITVYDKSALKTAIEELQTKSGYNQSIFNTANNILTTREVTQSQIDTQTTNVRNEINRVAKVALTEKYNNLSNKLTNLGVNSTTAGYKAIFDDLTIANNILNSSSIDNDAITASENALDYYLGIWDNYLASGTNRIIKGTFGDYFTTFIYPSKISLEMGQRLADLNYNFIVDANYNATNTDFRMFFDASGWGRGANVINEHFSNYGYTARHSIGTNISGMDWGFQNYENQSSVNNDWRFASVTYNSKPYLLVSAGNQTYKSTITISGSPKKAGQFTYDYNMDSFAQQWTSSWTTQYTISYSESVSIEFEINNAGVAEAKENLQTAKDGLINNLKNATGKITNLDAITQLINNIDVMLDSSSATADEINTLTQSVTNTTISVDRNWDEANTYCIEREIYVNQYVDSDGNKYNFVNINSNRITGDSDGKVIINVNTYSSPITITYPNGTSFTLNLNATHTGYKCEETSTCTICNTALEAREHNWVQGAKLHDATCVSGAEYEYTCSYDTSHIKTAIVGDIDPNNHSYGDWVVEKEANCLETGSKTRLCQNVGCGHIDTESIVALGHSHTEPIVTAPTCTEKGYTLYKCSRCEDIDPTICDEQPALDHLVTSWTDKGNATCTNNGDEYGTCTREGCGVVVERVKENSMLPHSYADTIVAPTCTEKGYTLHICSVCQFEMIDTETEIDLNNHDYSVEKQTIAPTCTEQGYTIYECSRCHNEDSEHKNIVPATGIHSYTIEQGDVVPATCTEDGYQMYKCEHCTETEKRITEAKLGHQHNVAIITPPTCVDDGYTMNKCSRCEDIDQTKYDIIPATGGTHSFTILQGDEVPATCTEDGYQMYKCEHCTATEKQVTEEKLGHEFNVVNTTIPPTCGDDGYTLYECSRCKELDETHKNIVPATGIHSYTIEQGDVVPATCTEDGYQMYKCEHCTETEKRITETKLGHQHNVAIITPPTCVDDGYTMYKCSRCEDINPTKQDITLATGHSYVDTVVAPTCIEKGYTLHICSVCQFEMSDNETEIDPDNHDHSVAVITAPTCTEDGYTLYKCSRCEDINPTKQDIIVAIGHSYVDTIVAPTCTEKGYTLHKCSRCDNEFTDNEVEINLDNHTWNDGVVTKEPTATEKGEKEFTCSGCGDKKVEEIPALGVVDKPVQPNEPEIANGPNIGAIVGGAVGGTAGLGILVLVIFIIIKKTKKV